MRLPPSPPKGSLESALSKMFDPEVRNFVAQANAEYYHWDKLRYRPRPTGVTAEEGWQLVHLSRVSQFRELPLLDAQGKPYRYWVPNAAEETLHEVDRWGGSVLAVSPEAAPALGAMRDRIVVSSLMEEAIATSQIEGAVTTRRVAKEMLRTKRTPRDRSEQMIVNSYRTIHLLRERLAEPLSLDLLFAIQESMTQNTLVDSTAAGRFRTQEEEITVVDATDGEVMHIPPEAEMLNERMVKLIEFANEPDTRGTFIHPLVKAAILHFWLAYEHPFVDGNGRTARALVYWYMLKKGYWLFEYLTISRVILAAPTEYYRSFVYSEHSGNDLTYSVMYQLKATRRALAQLREYLAAKQTEQQAMTTAIRNFPDLNHRQKEVLHEAMADPNREFTFKGHKNTQSITLVTARADLIDLEQKGLLSSAKIGKERVFRAAPELDDRLAGKKPKRRK